MKIKEGLLFFLINSTLFFFLIRSPLLAPFCAYGDSEVIAVAKSSVVKAFGEDEKKFSSLENNLKYWIGEGRSRPLLVAIQFIRARFFGVHPFYYRFTNYLAGVLTTLFFFIFLRGIGITRSVAYLVSLIFQTAPYAVTWYSIDDAEPWGAFFLILSLALFARAVAGQGETIKNKRTLFTYYLASLMLFCACQCKENFVFIVPFVILFLIAGYAYKNNLDLLSAIKQTKNILIVLSLVMIITLMLTGVTIFLAKNYFSYGHTASVYKNAKSNLILIVRPFLFLFPAIILLIREFRNRKLRTNLNRDGNQEHYLKINQTLGLSYYYCILLIIIICSGWIITQLIVYANYTMWVSRYLIPATIAPAVLLAISMDYFKRARLKKYYFGILAIYLIALGYRSYQLNMEASAYGQFSQAYNNVLDFMTDKHVQSVGIYGAPLYSSEFIRTSSFLLKAKNSNIDFFFIPDSTTVSSFWADANNQMMNDFPSHCRVTSLQEASKVKSEWIIIIGKTSGLPPEIATPALSYPYQGYSWAFNLSAFRFEKTTKPYFLLIKT